MNILTEYLNFLNYLHEEDNEQNVQKKRKIRTSWCKAHCWNLFHVMDANSRDMVGITTPEKCMEKCIKYPITWKPKGGIQEI